MGSDLVREEKGTASKEELLGDISHLSKRLRDYDWEYRLTRFEEKVSQEKGMVVNILEEMELSDNNKLSDK